MSKRFDSDQLCRWIAGDGDADTNQQIEEDLRHEESSDVMHWIERLAAAAKELERFEDKAYVDNWLGIVQRPEDADVDVAEPDAISQALDKSDAPDVPPLKQGRSGEASDPSTDQQDIDDFVKQEVLRLVNTRPPSALLGQDDLRWIRDNVVESARTASLLATIEDERALHVALVRAVRVQRRQNATATANSGLPQTKANAAEELVRLLAAQDHILDDLRADEAFAQVALWYQMAEDLAMSDDEVAALWAENLAVIRQALKDPRAEIQVERRRSV
jgi:hypothetical protein